MIDRRAFLGTLASGLLVAPHATEARATGQAPRVAFLFNSIPESEVTGPHPTDKYAKGFLEGMRELGWIDGQNITIERRSAEGQPERYAALARELVGRPVDLIVVAGTLGAAQVRKLNPSIPIVLAGGDPDSLLRLGLVKSISRPGGTVTGLTEDTDIAEHEAKRLQLLKEAVPRVSRVAYFGATSYLKSRTEAAASTLSLTLVPVEVAGSEGLDAAFAAVRRERVEAVSLANVPFL